VATPKKKYVPDNEARLRSLARAYTDVSIQTLGNFINSPNAEPDTKLRAIGIILDRGWGRPVSKTEVTGADGSNAIEVTIRTIVEGKK
jgi:hypothetical protein